MTGHDPVDIGCCHQYVACDEGNCELIIFDRWSTKRLNAESKSYLKISRNP
jgi:hypothetical protein